MTGVAIPTAQFLERAAKSIPTLHGVKFTNNDLMTLQECLALGEFDIVFGYDELLLAGLALGVKGAVGSTYNFAAPLYRRLIDDFGRGDFAAARSAVAERTYDPHASRIRLQPGVESDDAPGRRRLRPGAFAAPGNYGGGGARASPSRKGPGRAQPAALGTRVIVSRTGSTRICFVDTSSSGGGSPLTAT